MRTGDILGVADYGQAVRLHPDDPSDFDKRALAYLALGETEKAFADFDEAIRLSNIPPGHFLAYTIYYHRGRAYSDRAKADIERAVADFRKILDSFPKDPDAKQALRDLGVEP